MGEKRGGQRERQRDKGRGRHEGEGKVRHIFIFDYYVLLVFANPTSRAPAAMLIHPYICIYTCRNMYIPIWWTQINVYTYVDRQRKKYVHICVHI